MHQHQWIWVFSGSTGRPSGVFSTRERAETWISQHRLAGILTKLMVDVSSYDSALDQGLFRVKRPHESSAEFIANFTCAGFEHYHYKTEYVPSADLVRGV